ncbi:MAG TPA: DUF998 domain-containing protein [Ktedonobacteraceae bacterium]|jgi:hypothetical membrane protein|nr:DUF998 domain-containing protein [Ktedonobacteraceae bacterium]
MQQSQVQGRQTNFLFGIVIAGTVLTVLLEVIVQLLPPHYNAISQPESNLAIGPYGFLMNINFALRGIIYFIFLAALMRAIPKKGLSRSGLILLGVSAVGKLIIAFAETDLTSPPHTMHGIIHTLAALISFFCGGLGTLLVSRSLRHVPNVRPSQRFLVGLGTVTLIWSVVVIVTVVASAQIGVWGLLERIFTGLFSLWILVLAFGLWNYSSVDVMPFPYSSGEYR